MTSPRITIGLTAYREGADDLAACFASVLAQSDPRWECVAVLDGGADASTSRAFEALEHPRLRTLRQAANEGPYAGRHRAQRESTTGWYAHLDADDRLPAGAVARVLEALDRHAREGEGEADFVYGDYRVLPPEGGAEAAATLRRAGEIDPDALTDGPGATDLIPTSPIRLGLIDRLGGYAPELRRGGA
ncbi:MAG: glycosyltransferase, partial [Acidobacteriota bacterium]